MNKIQKIKEQIKNECLNSKHIQKWILEKLDRNYNKKIRFDFAKKMIKKRHDIVKNFILLD
jgi:hypothetical protein